jgi:hypothetical protein
MFLIRTFGCSLAANRTGAAAVLRRVESALVFTAIVLAGPGEVAGRDVSFISWRQAPYGIQSRSLDSADFNRDGFDDLVVMSGGSLRLLLADGAGGFSPPLAHFEGLAVAQQVIAADFDRDHNPDAVVLYADGNLWLFLGDGRGGLSTGTRYPTNATSLPISMAALDFDRDGDMDLAVALLGGSLGGRVQLVANDGAGTLTPIGSPPLIGPVLGRTTSGDFDGDGDADVAVTNKFALTVTVVFGDGAGHLGGEVTLATNSGAPPPPEGWPKPQPWGLAAGDFNADGVDDLLVANGIYDPLAGAGAGAGGLSTLVSDGFEYGNVALIHGSRTRRFGDPSFLPVDNGPIDLRVLDVNRDGQLDVAAAGDSVLTLLSAPDGSFVRRHRSGGGGSAITSGDFDADGRTDFAIVGLQPRVDVYLSLSGYELPGPFFLRTVPESEPKGRGGGATGVVVRDVNNDGLVDLVTANARYYNIVTFLGSGDGGFGPPLTSEVGAQPRRMAVVDLDSDGCVDVVLSTAAEGGQSPLELFVGDCRGRFPSVQRIANDVEYSRVAVADFNEDGVSDLATTGSRFDPQNPLGGFLGAQVLLGDGQGRFRVSASLDTRSATVLLVADLDADGHQDLLLNGIGALSTHLGRGDGSFDPPRTVPTVLGRSLDGAALGDFDEDGILDLALCESPGLPTVRFGDFWLRGDGRGNFVNPVHLTPEHFGLDTQASFVGPVLAHDFNGDGSTDIAAASDGGVAIFQLDRPGVFRPASSYFGMYLGCGGGSCTVTAADLNGDSLPDLVAPESALDIDGNLNVVLTLLFNDTPPERVVAGDANCDLQVTPADLDSLVRRLFSPLFRPGCKGTDANGDGFVSAADLTATVHNSGGA